MKALKSYFLSFVLFLVFDFVWLGYVMKEFNLAQLSHMGRIQDGNFDVLLLPAVLVYVLMSVLVVQFILPRVSTHTSLLRTFWFGALAGFLVYGIFDLTNLAILRDYPIAFAAVDMAWGTFSVGLVTVLVRKLAN